jgi:hypothetical protein
MKPGVLAQPRRPGFYPPFTRDEYEGESLALARRLAQLGLDGEVDVLRGCVSLGGRRRGEDELVPLKRLDAVRWHFDPAASCARRRAFVDTPGSRRFVLGAYEDGGWFVEELCNDVAGGDAKTLVDAQVAALRVLMALVPLPEGSEIDVDDNGYGTSVDAGDDDEERDD